MKDSAHLWLAVISLAYAAALTVICLLRSNRSGSSSTGNSEEDKEGPREVLAYLCGMHGLKADMDRYLNSNSEFQFSSEADRCGMLGTQDPKSDETKRRIEMLKSLLQYEEMSPRNRGIVHYNLARIAKAQGDNAACVKHLESAKEDIPKLLLTRLKLDPIFANQQTAN